MNPQKSPEITVQTLLALRQEEDAVRLITERLRVKEMGPADHIRTKHEVRDFLRAGGTNRTEAGEIVQRAQVRIAEESQREALRESQQQRRGLSMSD